MPVILATQEAEIRKISVQSRPSQTVSQDHSSKKKKKNPQNRAHGSGSRYMPCSNPRTAKKKKKIM
jgi:hypothetical protein